MKTYLKRQLNTVDWDFVTDSESQASGLHWYPGTFVPALPGVLIEAFSAPDAVVLDPFGGVGTTALAALLRGRRSITVDVNPIACLAAFTGVALVAVRLLEPRLFDHAIQEVGTVCAGIGSQKTMSFGSRDRLRKLDKLVESVIDYDGDAVRRFSEARPARTALLPWYGRQTLRRLIRLRNQFVRHPSKVVGAIGLTMVSSIARQLSSQTKSWGHIADNVLPHELIEKDVQRAANDWLQRTAKRVERSEPLGNVSKVAPLCYVRELNWLSEEISLPERPRLLVTSPPYAGAIDYTLAQRLSFYLLGANDDEVKRLCSIESGARRKRFNKLHIAEWSGELSRCVERQISIMGDPAVAAFVLPHKDHGRDRGETELKSMMAAHGWELEFEKHRSIRQVRARQSWTSIKRETILIFERT